MTTRFVQPGRVLDYANGGTAKISGAVVVVGTLVGVCLAAIAANATGSVQICGVFNLPKKAGDTPAQGAAVYWDATNGYITTTASGNTLAGKAFVAAASGDANVAVLLNGTPG